MTLGKLQKHLRLIFFILYWRVGLWKLYESNPLTWAIYLYIMNFEFTGLSSYNLYRALIYKSDLLLSILNYFTLSFISKTIQSTEGNLRKSTTPISLFLFQEWYIMYIYSQYIKSSNKSKQTTVVNVQHSWIDADCQDICTVSSLRWLISSLVNTCRHTHTYPNINT